MKEKLSLFVVALVESNTLLNVDSTTFQTYHWAQELKEIKNKKEHILTLSRHQIQDSSTLSCGSQDWVWNDFRTQT